MSDKIKELALKAFLPINAQTTEGIADMHTFDQPWFQEYSQRFAELIVSECISETAMIGPTRRTSRVGVRTRMCDRSRPVADAARAGRVFTPSRAGR